MLETLFLMVSLIKSGFKNRTALAVENLALRQQLAILNRRRPHPISKNSLPACPISFVGTARLVPRSCPDQSC